jgi:hypothetical protein
MQALGCALRAIVLTALIQQFRTRSTQALDCLHQAAVTLSQGDGLIVLDTMYAGRRVGLGKWHE